MKNKRIIYTNIDNNHIFNRYHNRYINPNRNNSTEIITSEKSKILDVLIHNFKYKFKLKQFKDYELEDNIVFYSTLHHGFNINYYMFTNDLKIYTKYKILN